MSAGPNILVSWEPRWRALREGVRPAFLRSTTALPLECDRGLPRISFATSLCVHAVIVLSLLAIGSSRIVNQVTVSQAAENEHVTYFSGRELPPVEDVSGAESGVSGRAGGRELFHPTQTIHASQGPQRVERISEVPLLALPRAAVPDVANLIAMRAMPAPPPAPVQRAAPQANAAPEMPALPAQAPAIAALTSRHTEVVQAAVDAPRRAVADLQISGADNVVPLPPPEPVSRLAHAPILPPPGASDRVPARALPQISSGNALANVVGPPPSAKSLAGTSSPHVGAPDPTLASGNGNTPGASGSSAGTTSGKGVILSARPGSVVGVPAPSSGTVAMSPRGGSEAGAGGSGGGTGIGAGAGSGAASHGAGPGAGVQGGGFGADLHAHGGTSPGPGPGGTGSGAAQQLAGVTIRGNSVTLGSFASTATVPTGSARSVLGPRRPPAITVVGTSRSGGALNRYGVLKGGKVYTIYLDTRLGPAVVEFSERPSGAGNFQADLTPPEPLSSDFPASVQAARLVVQCVIDRDGNIRDLKILDGRTEGLGANIVAALKNWHFRPVLRGEQAVAVDAIIGLGVDTR